MIGCVSVRYWLRLPLKRAQKNRPFLWRPIVRGLHGGRSSKDAKARKRAPADDCNNDQATEIETGKESEGRGCPPNQQPRLSGCVSTGHKGICADAEGERREQGERR